jgi:hypothetical protein
MFQHGARRPDSQERFSACGSRPDSDEPDCRRRGSGIPADPESIPASMQTDDLAMLRRYPDWAATLRAYWDAHLQFKQQIAEFDGWLARITSVPDVPVEALSGIHGKLIAFGYLKFELTPKDTILRYQLTPLGRMAVTGESSPDLSESGSDAEWALSA